MRSGGGERSVFCLILDLNSGKQEAAPGRGGLEMEDGFLCRSYG